MMTACLCLAVIDLIFQDTARPCKAPALQGCQKHSLGGITNNTSGQTSIIQSAQMIWDTVYICSETPQ